MPPIWVQLTIGPGNNSYNILIKTTTLFQTTKPHLFYDCGAYPFNYENSIDLCLLVTKGDIWVY